MYKIRIATIQDIPQLIEVQQSVITSAVNRRELPSVDLVGPEEARKKLEETINSPQVVILVATVEERIVGKGHINFYPDKKRVTLSSFEVSRPYEGLGIALDFVKQGLHITQERYSQIQTLRVGRYEISENYRRRNIIRDTFFDRVSRLSGVIVESGTWEGEPMKWYNIPIQTAVSLISLYGNIVYRFSSD